MDQTIKNTATPPALSPKRPVDAACFRAALLPDAIILSWRFEHPELLEGAYLERSTTGKTFSVIRALQKEARAYTDVMPIPGSSYRIRMIAKDGTVVISSVIVTDRAQTPLATRP